MVKVIIESPSESVETAYLAAVRAEGNARTEHVVAVERYLLSDCQANRDALLAAQQAHTVARGVTFAAARAAGL